MKYLILTLFFVSLVSAKAPKIDYHGEISGNFDSNIGQNMLEQPKFYVTPSLGGSWFPKQGIAFGRVDLSYELHVLDRAPKYNDPLVDVGVGAEVKSGTFRITPELSFALWYVNKVTIGDNPTERNFVIAQRKVKLETPMKLVFPRQIVKFGLIGSYTDEMGNQLDGLDISLEPGWSYRFKKKKKAFVQMRSAGADGSLDFNLAKGNTKKFTQGEISPDMSVRVGKKGAYVSLSGSYARRIYGAPIPDPQSSDSLTELVSIISGSGFLDVPVVKDLHVQAGTKLRVRNSNISYDEWNRNTAFIRIKWDSSLGKDSD